MKSVVLSLMLALSLPCWAQQNSSQEAVPAGTVQASVNFPIERVHTPTAADLYCAGFVGKPISSKDKYVTGGLESPFSTRFSNGEAIFLNGKGYELGAEYTVIREIKDPNRYEIFSGQWAALKAAGQPYDELARIKVIDTRHQMAVAKIEFSCDTVVPGDFVIPYAEKSAVAFHSPIRFDRFAPPNGQTNGRILLAKDFDTELGNGSKVYVNIGASNGLKVGDYLRVTRTYSGDMRDPVASLSFKASATEETQTRNAQIDPSFLDGKKGPVVHTAEMPRRAVAEAVVIGTTPGTATAMIVFSLESVHLGDRVELDQQ